MGEPVFAMQNPHACTATLACLRPLPRLLQVHQAEHSGPCQHSLHW